MKARASGTGALAGGWRALVVETVAELGRRIRRREEIVTAAPTLVETYAVLTRLPPPYRLRPADALALIEGSWSQVEVAALDGTATWPLLRRLREAGIAGGSTYDAVVAACARKAGVDVILTWNVADFERVAEDIEVKSPEPEAPPVRRRPSRAPLPG